MKWFDWITFVMSIVTQILPLIMTIEKQIGGGNGALKKEIALQAVDSMAMSNNATIDQRNSLESIASGLIDQHIKSINIAKEKTEN